MKDKGTVQGFPFCIMTLLVVGFILLLSIQYSNASQTMANVENAQVAAGFAGFRSPEDSYIVGRQFEVTAQSFEDSCRSFLYHLKRNLNLDRPIDGTLLLYPNENSLFPEKDLKGNAIHGEVLEIRLYVVNSGRLNIENKIEVWQKTTSGITHSTMPAKDITYAGETIIKKSELDGKTETHGPDQTNDSRLILCTKVKIPQTNFFAFNESGENVGTTAYLTKTCVIRWKRKEER